jgi:hypothetical protein
MSLSHRATSAELNTCTQAVCRINDNGQLQENAIRELYTITDSAFQEAFQQWKKRWERHIASRGDYSEGDSAQNDVKWAIKSL